MNIRPIFLYAFLMYAISAGAQKSTTSSSNATLEPDKYAQPLPPVAPMRRTAEVNFIIRNTHSLSNKKGIDVSHYQGRINWQSVAMDDHASYVYIKATENATLVDNMFQANLREAHAAGIPVGCYHFFSPTASPLTQLANFSQTVPTLYGHDLVPMVDVEARGKCSLTEFQDRLRLFLVGIEQKYGVKPIIYTGANFYNRYLVGAFSEYLFMIARYGDEVPVLEGNPKFAIWQYSAKGRVAGINGDVDLSRFIDNYGLKDILIKK